MACQLTENETTIILIISLALESNTKHTMVPIRQRKSFTAFLFHLAVNTVFGLLFEYNKQFDDVTLEL